MYSGRKKGPEFPITGVGGVWVDHAWLSQSLILDPDMIRGFYAEHPDKPGRPPGGVHGGEGTVRTGSSLNWYVVWLLLCSPVCFIVGAAVGDWLGIQ